MKPHFARESFSDLEEDVRQSVKRIHRLIPSSHTALFSCCRCFVWEHLQWWKLGFRKSSTLEAQLPIILRRATILGHPLFNLLL
jgi:hypothetical protein